MVMLHIQLKGITKCIGRVANLLPADPYPTPTPLTLGIWTVGQTSTFSEHGSVAYQIKGNHEMQQHGSKYFARRSLPNPPPL